MRIFNIILSLTLSLNLLAEKQSPQQYVDKYKILAVIEMHRSGVPASITLAQGILESSSGNSRLAKYANNHFGIKCKGGWMGDKIYADDDAPDECFRAYPSVLESYKDHSEFLRTNWRYHPLFELEITDYKAWCRGLRKAGYATNPKYHTILIKLIERYELYQYDTYPIPSNQPMQIQTVNNVPYTLALEGQTLTSIARDHDVRSRHIRKWNDLPKSAEISEGDMVYLKPKRRRGSAPKHTVQEGETMHSISQKYGIKLKLLYRKNRMDRGTQPAVGETLNMQRKVKRGTTIKIAPEEPEWQESEETFSNPHSTPLVDTMKVDYSNPGAVGFETVETPEFHVVRKGDNIYRIAERYKVFEEDLLAWNKDLDPAALRIGQQIYLSEEAARKYGSIPVDEPVDESVTEMDSLTESETVTDSISEDALTDEEVEQLQEEIPVSGPITHLVVKGDTVYNICKRYGISAAQLKSWNQMEDVTIKIGQKLQVSE